MVSFEGVYTLISGSDDDLDSKSRGLCLLSRLEFDSVTVVNESASVKDWKKNIHTYMEKPSFVVNGGVRLPIGYRFRPTDEELVVHYLKRKAFGLPLPASVIPHFDVFQAHPWALPGDLKEKRYFFGKRNGNVGGKNCKIGAGSGYWKYIGKDRQIVGSGGNREAVGLRKTLVFCEGKRAHHETKTRWVMHEYRLIMGTASTNLIHSTHHLV
ncbi:hypothetical protein JRO89_XS01G0213800 [Xanthoceras sorbifolium]|uniref:NAC domain-containing protein n=1 Tax=Xanthoceras sorbifolium TaxID=99658 RepID=A0ABQ8IKE3_9ROSI|nr:hypothetical protein JRO89_XS01G0213800 [Xanthoceras sorbifolium]